MGGPRLALARPVDGIFQVRYNTSLTIEAYVSRRAWWEASPPECPYHRQGGCRLVPHGTYARKTPESVRVRRFLCPQTRRTVSLLPDGLAAQSALADVERVVRTVDRAGSMEQAADQLRTDTVTLPTALRWVRLRVHRVRAFLATWGARQRLDFSGFWRFTVGQYRARRFAVILPLGLVTPSPGPEILVTPSQDAGAHGEDPFGSVLGPEDAGLLEAPHDRLAAALDHAGADLQALGAELGVAHSLAVGDDVVHGLGVLPRSGRHARAGSPAPRLEPRS